MARVAAKVSKARKRKNLFLHFRIAATNAIGVKERLHFDMTEPNDFAL